MQGKRFLLWGLLSTLPACASRCDSCDGDGCEGDSDEILLFEKTLEVDAAGEYAFAGLSYRDEDTGQEWSAVHVVDLASGAVTSLDVTSVELGGIGGTTFVAEGCGGLCLVPTSPPFAVTTTAFSGTIVAIASSSGSAAILGDDGANGFVETRGSSPTARVGILPNPLGLAIGSGLAYAVGGSAVQVSVVRLSTATEELRVQLPCEPAGPVGVMSGSSLLLGCAGSGLMEFDPYTLASAAVPAASPPVFITAGPGYALVSFSNAGGETSLYSETTGFIGLPIASLLVDDAVFGSTSVYVALESGVARLSLADATIVAIPGIGENDARPRIARLPSGGVAALIGSRLVLLDESGNAIGDPIDLPR